MAIGRTNAGGGSGGLALKVIGSETQPSNPKYPTIWVKTDVPIDSWELNSASQPSWPASTGTVYFVSSTTVGGTPASGDKVLNPLKKNAIYLLPNMCWQDIGTADATVWAQREAWLYNRVNEWVKIAIAFEATINITYPSGSTCTVTNGTYTLTAPDTTGIWACVVPVTATWTVSCTDGSRSESKAVSITSDGQTESVSLDYKLYLFNNGTAASLTGGVAFSPANVGAVQNGRIETFVIYGYNTWFNFVNKIDVTDYNKLCFNVYAASSWGGLQNVMGAGDNINWQKSVSTGNTAGVFTVDISGLSGNKVIGVVSGGTFQQTSTGDTLRKATIKVSQIWLEK